MKKCYLELIAFSIFIVINYGYNNVLGVDYSNLNYEVSNNSNFRINYRLISLRDPHLPVNSVGRNKLIEALKLSRKGQVWITKDGNSFIINHGHSALFLGYSSWWTGTLEHRGNSNPFEWDSSYSKIYEIDITSESEYWNNVHTLRTYDVSNVENGKPDYEKMSVAVDYALNENNGLIGKKYAALALKSSKTCVNCSTLVYQAYFNKSKYSDKSIELGNKNSFTVVPKDLVEDKKLIPVFSSGWEGDMHKW